MVDYKNVVTVLNEARKNGISVFKEGQKLKFSIAQNKKVNPEIVHLLKDKKEEILTFLNNDIGTFKSLQHQESSIVPIDRAQVKYLPLSFSQESLWLVDKLSGSTNYHVPLLREFEGHLDAVVFEEALTAFINRHEVLRTVYLESEGHPYQKVLSSDQWKLNHKKVKNEKELSELNEWITNEISRPFDLKADYMLRATLIELNNGSYLLVMVTHHIATDGWSSNVMDRDVMELYESKLAGKKTDLKPLEIQYADYAYWQRKELSGDSLEKKLTYWEDQLKNVSPLSFHLDKPRPRIQTFVGNSLSIKIDPSTTKALQDLSKEHGMTLFMSLLAAFKVLMYRYSGQEDICIGSPVANRSKKSLEDLIGFFVNMIALRSTVSGKQTFNEFLLAVKQTTMDAYKHQDAPFEKVVERVVKTRDSSMSPLFQVIFAMQPPLKSTDSANTDSYEKEERGKYDVSKFDLTVTAVEAGNGILVTLGYCTALFNESTIRQMGIHFQQLLKSIVAKPEQEIIELNMMSDEERNSVLIDFNQTEVDYAENRTVIEFFNQQALDHPDKIALVGKNRSLTYRQLNETTNQLARYLKKRNVQSGDLIAICMDRSIEMIISFLGIMKAGAAYVPIDPAYPKSRVQYIIEDTNTPLVISSKMESGKIENTADSSLLVFEDVQKEMLLETATNLCDIPNPEQRAYVIYTSGSTGKPKGVIIQHKSLTNFINWYSDVYKTDSTTRSTWYAGVGFDASVFELWPCFSSGGSLYIVDNEIRLDLKKLFDYHLIHKISHSCLPTALIPSFVEISRNQSTSLDFLMTGGDVLPALDIDGLDYQLINNYGPTENTVVATYYPMTSVNKNELPPIGKQASNVKVYVLDATKKLTPIGIEGELYIGGMSLAEGYLNRPELNLERFVANPFSENPEDRLYKTGDMVRWAQDGNLQFIGRKDAQIQIRGYRIELGEIENIFQKCPLITQSAIIVKQDAVLGKRLIAYAIPEDKTVDQVAVKAFLNKELPEYMVPSLIVFVESIPLTPNGKLDKKALPDPGLLEEDRIPPQNKVQEEIAAIWKERLNIKTIGINDNFFELGGHSLIAASILFSMNKIFQSQLRLMDFFTHPTIKQISALLKVQKSSKTTVALIEEPVPHLPNLFFVPPILGSPIVFKTLAMELEGMINSYGIQYNGLNDAKSKVGGIEQRAEKMVQSILEVQSAGEFIICGYSMGATIAYAMAKKLEQLGHSVKLILMDRIAQEKQTFTDSEINDQVQFHLTLLKELLPEDNFGPEGLKFIENQLKGNIRMLIDYEVSGMLNCPILALEAREGKEASQMQEWSAFTNNEFQHEWLKGGHYDILNAEYINDVKKLILDYAIKCVAA